MKCELCGTQFRIVTVGRKFICVECEKDYAARQFGIITNRG